MTQPTLTYPSQIMKSGETVTVRRYSQGVYRKGDYVEGTCRRWKIKANIQPVSGFTLMQVPEGERHRRHYDLFSQCLLEVKDTVDRDGLEYEIKRAEKWGAYGRHLMVLKDGQEQDTDGRH